MLRTSDSDSAPQTLKVIINREDVDFGVAEETDGTQTFELSRTSEVQELPVVCTPSALLKEGWFSANNTGSAGRGSMPSAG